jgi:hypothetical protein
MAPRHGSLGVVRDLNRNTFRECGWTITTSVKVPPMSRPTSHDRRRAGRASERALEADFVPGSNIIGQLFQDF